MNPSTQFNQISVDRTGTPLQSLNAANPEISSRATGNQAFFQPITVVYTKLLFPTITNLLSYQDYLAVMKAELIIKPVQGTYSPLYNLPPILNMTLTQSGQHNRTNIALRKWGISLLTICMERIQVIRMTFTTYIQNALTQGAENNAKNGLMLVAPNTTFNTSFNRNVFGRCFQCSEVKSNFTANLLRFILLK